MSNLVVITFDNAEEAGKVRESLRSLEHQGLLSLDDSAVVVKDAEDKIHVKNQTDRGVLVGAVAGGSLGLLIGSIFFPFAGLISGALIGAIGGRMADLGVDKKFVEEVGAALKPDSSAIFVVVRGSNPAAVVATLKPYRGQVYQTTLPTEAEEELRRILSKGAASV
jgi:uncharacterized membrane protein